MPILSLGLSLYKTIKSAGAVALSYVTDSLKVYFNFAKETSEDPVYTGHKEVQFASAGSTYLAEDADVKVIIDDSTDWDFGTGNWAYSFWVKAPYKHNSEIFRIGYDSATRGLGLWMNTNKWYWELDDSTNSNPYSENSASHSIAWTHHVITRTGPTELKVYTDGILTDTDTIVATDAWDLQGEGSFEFGGHGSATLSSEFNIANFGVWGRALYQEEVQSIMHKQYADLNATEKGSLRGWWNFDNTTAAVNNSSILFDGESDTLTITDSEFAFGNDDFTYECWVNFVDRTNDSSQQVFFDSRESNAADKGVYCFKNTSHQIAFYDGSGVSAGTTAMANDTWYHLAWSRSSGTLKMFVDGSQEFSGSEDTDCTDDQLTIGADYGNSSGAHHCIDGYLDEIRVSDTARYTAGFTPSTTAFVSDANTKLLIHGNSIADVSGSTHAITNNGDTVVSGGANTNVPDSHTTNNDGTATGASLNSSVYGGNAPKLPRSIDVATATFGDAIGGGSFEFDGNDDHIRLPDSSDFPAGDDNTTIMFWVYQDDTANKCFFSRGASANDELFAFVYNSGAGPIRINHHANDLQTGVTLPIKEWHHLACTYDGTNTDFYYDGVLSATQVTGTLDIPNQTGRIGEYTTGDYPEHDGKMAQFGIWSRALTGAEINSVMEKTYSEFTDAEKVDLEGQWGLDTAPLKALDFDGSNDYVDMGTAIPTAFGDSFAGPFSVSLWIRPDTVTADDGYFTIYDGSGHGVAQLTFWQNGGKNLYQWLLDDTGGYQWSINYEVFTVNAWHHIVAIYDGSDVTKSVLYIDGVAGTKISGDADGSHPATMDMDGLSVHFGRYYGTTQSFDGAIAKTAIWEKDMSGSASTLYNLGIEGDWSGVESSDLKGYWDMTGDTITKIGSSTSIKFDGTDDYIKVDISDDSQWYTAEDFCYETWIYPTHSVGTRVGYFNSLPYDDIEFELYTNNKFMFYIRDASDGSAMVNLFSGVEYASADVGKWMHLAFVRNGTKCSIYKNGVSIAEDDSVGNDGAIQDRGGKMVFGTYGTNAEFQGHMEDVRIVYGNPVYTGNFTPPTALTTTGGTYSSATNVNTGFSASLTKLLVHSNTTDGSTTFTDSSTLGQTLTATSAPVHSDDANVHIEDSSANSNTATISGATQVDAITLDSTSNNNDGAIN